MRQQTLNHDVIAPVDAVHELPRVRRIHFSDLKDALAKGVEDFNAMPTHALFLGLIYAVIGLALFRLAFGYDVFPLVYPVAAGFAILGPFAAVGLYELSRRREMGRDTFWTHAFDARHSPSFKSILALGAMLLLLFLVWISIAHSMYLSRFGYGSHATLGAFLSDVVNTAEGRDLFWRGNLIGLGFAVLALMVSVVSFPLLLDRNVGVASAVSTSVRAVLKNPVEMFTWGLIVAVSLFIGALPLLFGLAVVFPVLGHATWHLYRKVVVPDTRPRPEFEPRERRPRYAAEFPASLFVGSSVRHDDEEGGQR